MKKKFMVSAAVAGLMAASFAIGAYAASDIKLFINGKQIDTPVEIIDGSSYVPLRVVSESLGAEVKWDGDARTITITGGTKQAQEAAKIEEPSAQESFTAGDFIITDLTADKGQFGWDITAEVKNSGTKDINGASLTATFYNKDGKRVGKATGSVLDIKNGESKTVTFLTIDDLTGYASIKFQVDYSY